MTIPELIAASSLAFAKLTKHPSGGEKKVIATFLDYLGTPLAKATAVPLLLIRTLCSQKEKAEY
jgi:hypothetical protein